MSVCVCVCVCVFVSVIQNFTLLLLQELVVRESSRRFCRAELCVNLLGIVFEKESKALLRLSKRDVSEQRRLFMTKTETDVSDLRHGVVCVFF